MCVELEHREIAYFILQSKRTCRDGGVLKVKLLRLKDRKMHFRRMCYCWLPVN